MILPDVNILIYAANADAPSHRRAKAWLETILSSHETVGVPWTCWIPGLSSRGQRSCIPGRAT
jgi:predicted nucleic acid-binding protein